MTHSPQQLRERARWYPLRPIPAQLELLASTARFKVVPAGRRSGKTERAKRHLVKRASQVVGNYFAAAPTRPQVKRIFWDDIKLLTFSSTHARAPSETELTVWLPNGSSISLIGLDEPARIEGSPWHGGVIDEYGNVKPHAWAENIQPALNTINPNAPEYRAWCWLLGVPEGLNHYYERARYAASGVDSDWSYHTWHSAEVLPADVIAAARRDLSARQFRQEYEAAFEGATGRIYTEYSNDNHTSATLEPHAAIYWCHDFNFTPLSSAVCTKIDGVYRVVDEIVLEHAIAAQSAAEFVQRYASHANKTVYLYGDPAGKAGEKHGHESDYTSIESTLRAHGWSVTRRVRAAAPAITDRQNAVRAFICNAAGERRLFVNPERAKYADKGLSTVQLKTGSAFLENETDYQHITTAIGYMIEHDHPTNQSVIDVSFSFAT